MKANDPIYKHVITYAGDSYVLECKFTGQMSSRYMYYKEPNGTIRTTCRKFERPINCHRQKLYYVLLEEEDMEKAKRILALYCKGKIRDHSKKVEFFSDILSALGGDQDG